MRVGQTIEVNWYGRSHTYRCIASPFALAAWITTVELASDRLVHVVCKAVGVVDICRVLPILYMKKL